MSRKEFAPEIECEDELNTSVEYKENTLTLRMNEPMITQKSYEYVDAVLRSGWLSVEGDMVKKLEKTLGEIFGHPFNNLITSYNPEFDEISQGKLEDKEDKEEKKTEMFCCAVNSGTAAVYGAMKALGVKNKNQFVICQAFTCAACADAVVHAGGSPFIVDVEPETFSLSSEALRRSLCDLETNINYKDSVVVGVILAPCYGVPSMDFEKILSICKEHKIWLCLDNCECYGSSINGRFIEKCVDVTVISMRSEKMIGVGEGGCIISKNKMLIDSARWWCSRAPSNGDVWDYYKHEEVGMNYRMPEILAALGIVGTENLHEMIDKKRKIHSWYELEQNNCSSSQIRLQGHSVDSQPVWWINAVILPKGTKARMVGNYIKSSWREGVSRVEIRPGFYPLCDMKPFSELSAPCPIANDLFERVICLPSSHELTRNNVRFIWNTLVTALNECINRTDI